MMSELLVASWETVTRRALLIAEVPGAAIAVSLAANPRSDP